MLLDKSQIIGWEQIGERCIETKAAASTIERECKSTKYKSKDSITQDNVYEQPSTN